MSKELERKIDAMHNSLRELFDSIRGVVTKHDAMVDELRSLRVVLAQMDARVRKLEHGGLLQRD